MKHYITSSQAAIIIETLEKIKVAQDKSQTIMAAIDIDRRTINTCETVIRNLKNEKPAWI